MASRGGEQKQKRASAFSQAPPAAARKRPKADDLVAQSGSATDPGRDSPPATVSLYKPCTPSAPSPQQTLQAMLACLSGLAAEVRLSGSPVGNKISAVANIASALSESIGSTLLFTERHPARERCPMADAGWFMDVALCVDLAARLVALSSQPQLFDAGAQAAAAADADQSSRKDAGEVELGDAPASGAAACAETAPSPHYLLAVTKQVRRLAVEQEKLERAEKHLLRVRASEAGTWARAASKELKTHMKSQDEAVIRIAATAVAHIEARGIDALAHVNRLLRGKEEGDARAILSWLVSAKEAYDEVYAIKAFPTQLGPELPPPDLPKVSVRCEPEVHASTSLAV
jgi:uncharacterized lipoprotein NlpE involved in copper resistance